MAITIHVRSDLSENFSYINPQFPVYIRKGVLSDYHNYRATSHWHEDLEFIVILSGEMQYDINGEIVAIHENEGIMVNSRNFHFGFSNERKECEFICIVFHPSLFSGNHYLQERYVTPLVECTDLPYLALLDVPWQEELRRVLLSMYHLKSDTDEFYPKCQSLISRILVLLHENTRDVVRTEYQISNRTLTQLRKMVQFVQEHFSEPLSLEEIAASGEMGKTSCTAAFRTYMHTTPIEYLLTYRLTQSARLLAEMDQSITEIAYNVGFHDASYFTKTFKKYYEMTPKEMRKSLATSDE